MINFDAHKLAFIIDGMELKFNPNMVKNLVGLREEKWEVDIESRGKILK